MSHQMIDDHAEPGKIVDVSKGPEPSPRQYLIDGMEEEGTVVGFYGTEGVLKTYHAINRAISLLAGAPYLGHEVKRQQSVLFLDWELNEVEFRRRAWHVARGMGMEGPPAGLYYTRMRRRLLDSLDEVRAAITATGAGSIVIDSLSFAGITNEETAIAAINALGDLGVGVAVYDHQARVQRLEGYEAKQPYGSRFKEAGFWSLFQIELADIQPERGQDVLFRDKKFRSGAKRAPVGVRVTFASDRVCFEVIDPANSVGLMEKLPAEQRVLAALSTLGETDSEAVAQHTGLKPSSARTYLSRLKRRGLSIDRPGELPNSPHLWSLPSPRTIRDDSIKGVIASTRPENQRQSSPSTRKSTEQSTRIFDIDFGAFQEPEEAIGRCLSCGGTVTERLLTCRECRINQEMEV